MLRRDSHQLEQSLRDAGFGLGSTGIGFSLRQDGSPKQDGQAPSSSAAIPPDEREQPATVAQTPPRSIDRLLDLEI